MAKYSIGNELITRTLELDENGVRTISLVNGYTGREYVKDPQPEFFVTVDGVRHGSVGSRRVLEVDGTVETTRADFGLLGVESTGQSLVIKLVLGTLGIDVCYRCFPGVPGLEKHLRFTNNGARDVKLETLIFDNVCMAPGDFCDCDFRRGHEDVIAPICFTNDGNEDIVRCHNPKLDEGWMLGSTAPGILRYFLVYTHWGNIMNGYSCGGAPFAKYLAPGEVFETDSSLVSVYQGGPSEAVGFRDLIRCVLPPPVAPEGIMYCSWLPFLCNINAGLVCSLMEKASEMGFRYFVLDDGWFTPQGDHQVDRAKFPNGLEEITAKAASCGLTFGLWFNIGTTYGQDAPHDEWLALRADGKPNHLGFDYSSAQPVLCFGTEHRDYVLAKLDELCTKYNVGYFKLDFSSVFSPYGILPWGCHATNHKYHHGWNDSFIEMYRGMMAMRKELKKRHPNVIVDFSFEAFGTELPNIAALQYSELHHVSNTSANNTQCQSIDRVRRSFYHWLKKLPPERILNGLLSIQGPRGVEYFLSSLAGAPLVAGDLLKLDDDVRVRIRKMCDAFGKLVATGPLTEFAVLASEEAYDGFIRYAKDGRGIACLFNRSDKLVSFTLPAGAPTSWRNVEDGGSNLTVAPNACVMFVAE